MISPDAVKVFDLLAVKGYKEYNPPHGTEEFVSGARFRRRAFERRLNTLDATVSQAFPCLMNGDKLAVHVTWTEVLAWNVLSSTFEVQLVGEVAENVWTDLKFYGLSAEETYQSLTTFEGRLVQAWKFMHG